MPRSFSVLISIFSIMFLTGCSGGLPTIATSTSLGYADATGDKVSTDVRRELQQDLEEAATTVEKREKTKKQESPKLDALAARDMINAYRKQKGLKPIILHPQLTEAAKAHSRDLAKRDQISHIGVDGTTPWDRVKRTGFKAALAAENVGTGQMKLKQVVKGWQKSPSHNENLLLPDATHMGIAMEFKPESQSKTFWTLVLGTPL